MLGKLLKYELRGTAHYFLPLFGVMLVFSLLNRLAGTLLNRVNIITGLLIFAEIALMIAVGLMTLIITIRRFYKNLLGNEGYLMFTLPVSTHHNILAKLLAAIIWIIVAFVLIIFSIILMMWQAGSVGQIFQQMWWSFNYGMAVEMGLHPLVIILQWLAISLAGLAASILLLYWAMALGQLANVHKFMASVGAYLALIICQTVLLVIFGNILIEYPPTWLEPFGLWLESFSPAAQTSFATFLLCMGNLLLGAIYYFFTHRLLKNRLNLT